jgi:hypothetical protein
MILFQLTLSFQLGRMRTNLQLLLKAIKMYCHDLHPQKPRPRRRKFLQEFLFLEYLFIYNNTSNGHIM